MPGHEEICFEPQRLETTKMHEGRLSFFLVEPPTEGYQWAKKLRGRKAII
ncbi:MAG: hypothetical protein ACTHNG_16900 [Ginsengibacter sp.]